MRSSSSRAWRRRCALDRRGDRAVADRARTAALGGPTLATAAAASAAAILVLALSPVPMVRGFGVLLVVGVGIALLCALTRRRGGARAAAARAAARCARSRARAPRCAPRGGARASCCSTIPSIASLSRVALVVAVRRPGRVLARRARARGARLGARHADEGGDRHHQARTPEPELAAEPERARADHGVGGEIDLMVRGEEPRQARRRSNG